jgi:peptidoglycan/xylan/chitin deacetylase (PgdA/CDA1 family)
LRLLHRVRHKHALTVLMFHRVLPEQLSNQLSADPEYTISTNLLDALLGIVKSYYNIVDLPDVLASHRGEKALPDVPLLITFDDGWHDNAVFAAPLFAAEKIPWTMFVATDALSPPKTWWQETLLWALRSGRANYQELWNLVAEQDAEGASPDDPTLRLLMRFGVLEDDRRTDLLQKLSAARGDILTAPDMASLATLRELQARGVRIGLHGASHLPLTALADPGADIRRSADVLRKEIGIESVMAMSFPHGRFDAGVIAAAQAAGVPLLFTSDPVINICPGGRLAGNLIGRISISTKAIANSKGMLDLERLVPRLILRQVA